jgi:hypothetical protein
MKGYEKSSLVNIGDAMSLFLESQKHLGKWVSTQTYNPF